jgi:hypothetical protein
MDSRNQYAVLGLAFVHDIGKNVVHRASRSNEFKALPRNSDGAIAQSDFSSGNTKIRRL